MSNEQRATEVLGAFANPNTPELNQRVAAALDAAEARGRAEVAARIQQILDSVPVSLTARDRLRALVADVAPAGQGGP